MHTLYCTLQNKPHTLCTVQCKPLTARHTTHLCPVHWNYWKKWCYYRAAVQKQEEMNIHWYVRVVACRRCWQPPLYSTAWYSAAVLLLWGQKKVRNLLQQLLLLKGKCAVILSGHHSGRPLAILPLYSPLQPVFCQPGPRHVARQGISCPKYLAEHSGCPF